MVMVRDKKGVFRVLYRQVIHLFSSNTYFLPTLIFRGLETKFEKFSL